MSAFLISFPVVTTITFTQRILRPLAAKLPLKLKILFKCCSETNTEFKRIAKVYLVYTKTLNPTETSHRLVVE